MNTKLKKTIVALAACACLVLFMSAGCGAKTVAVKRKGTTAAVVRRNEKVILTAPKTAEKGKLRWYEKRKGVWKAVGRGRRLTRRYGKYGRFRLKCVRRSGGKKRTAKIEIAVIAGKLTVAEQPRNAVVRDGGTAVFEISLSERNPNATYQWQKKKENSFIDVKGATKSTYAFRADAGMNGSEYRCAASQIGSRKKTYSTPARLTVTSSEKPAESVLNGLRGYVAPKTSDGYVFVHCLDGRYRKAAKAAISLIEKFSGPLFAYAENSTEADLIVAGYASSSGKSIHPAFLKGESLAACAANPNWLAAAHSTDSGMHYMITVDEDKCAPNSKLAVNMFVHELLHCIKIGHSTDRRSVMRPCVGTDSVITESDGILIARNAEYFRRTLGRQEGK